MAWRDGGRQDWRLGESLQEREERSGWHGEMAACEIVKKLPFKKKNLSHIKKTIKSIKIFYRFFM